MKKRLLSFIPVFVILATIFTALPSAAFAKTGGKCGSDLEWTLDESGMLTISGTGDMTDWSSSSEVPWSLLSKDITGVTIENGVTNIGSYAFRNCSGLTSVTIPDGVTNIGNSAFYNCSSLERVYITDIAAWCNIDFKSNSSNPLCYAYNFYLNGNLVTDLEIPSSVTSIGNYAFFWCSSLESVTIPDSVTSIGDFAFSGCGSIASITIPDSVTSIGDYAFYDCSGLTEITIPNGVTSIGEGAFEECRNLERIIIGYSVTSIGDYAFYDCISLTSVEISDSVTSIGDFAFAYCTVLTSVEIPDSVTNIGYGAFYNCSSLENIKVNESNQNYCSVDGNLFNKDKTELIQYAIGKTDTGYDVPDSVTSIGE